MTRSQRNTLLIIISSLLLGILFWLIVPEIVLEEQILYQTRQILDRSDSVEFAKDQSSYDYLKKHPQLYLVDVTDAQGSNGNESYHVGTLKNGSSLGIYVHHDHPNIPFSKITIRNIKVWNRS